MRKAALVLIMAIPLAGCWSRPDVPVPPKTDSAPVMERQLSSLSVPIEVSLDDIQRALDQRVPRELWSIDEAGQTCVPPQRVKLFGKKVKVTPTVRCRITGQATRGRISLKGSGRRLTIDLPVHATVRASDVGGIIKHETVTASAQVRADVTIRLDRDWNPHAKVDLAYDWTAPPGIDFLGQRIDFATRADKKLAGVIARLERELQREIARVRVRPVIAGAWRQGFTVIELNREKPPAWMTVTPTGLGLASYSVEGRKLILRAEAEAWTESFISAQRPASPKPTPLPPQIGNVAHKGLKFFIPVTGDYAQIEPVILRALRRLAAKGISVEGVGSVDADFQQVTVHATTGNRLAVGIKAEVEPVGARFGTRLGKSKGEVWLTAKAVNAADSTVVEVRDLTIYGDADGLATDLLIQLLGTDSVRQEIAMALKQDFQKDFDHVITAARRAVASRQQGDFALSVRIDEVRHDPIQVTGEGLFLPVFVTGQGQIRYNPRPGKR